MSWCQTGRILLVWPADGRVLNRKIDLILARRYATALGSELAVATNDDEVRFYARQVGIPVFIDPRQAQEQEWAESSQKQVDRQPRANLPGLDNLRKSIRSQTPAWLEHPAAKIACLGISLLALLALAIVILPGAKVTLSPREEVQSISLDLIADPSAATINLSTGSLPIYKQEVTVEGTDFITARGTMTIPDKPASGMIKFTNRSKATITLPAGTIVTTLGTDRVRFKTVSQDDSVIKPNKSVLVEALAIRPGTSGNLPLNSLVAIEGDLGLKLEVTNTEATRGGLDAAVPTATTQDLQTLREKLISRLLAEALTELQSNLPIDDTLITPSATITQVMEEAYNPAVGVPTEQVELSMRIRINAQAVSGKVLQNMAKPILDAGIPAGYSAVMDTLVVTPLTKPTLKADGKAYWMVNASRKLQADIPTSLAIESIRGVTAANAADRLSESMPLAQPAKIVLMPSWWPRLPLLAMRITFVEADAQ